MFSLSLVTCHVCGNPLSGDAVERLIQAILSDTRIANESYLCPSCVEHPNLDAMKERIARRGLK